MAAVDADQSGIASGVINASRQIGGALGIAVLGSIAAMLARADWLRQSALLGATAHAQSSRLTTLVLGGQGKVIGRLAGHPAEAAGLESFAYGLRGALLISSALTLVGAGSRSSRLAPSPAVLRDVRWSRLGGTRGGGMSAAPKPAKRGRPRSEARKQAILDAAFVLLGEHGLGATSMDAVAERAGVSKATNSCCAASNSAGRDRWVMSPVWMMSAGCSLIAFTRSMLCPSVPLTSGLASLLKPMWVSLICTNSGLPARVRTAGFAAATARSIGVNTPPAIANSVPAPPKAMHLRALRRECSFESAIGRLLCRYRRKDSAAARGYSGAGKKS